MDAGRSLLYAHHVEDVACSERSDRIIVSHCDELHEVNVAGDAWRLSENLNVEHIGQDLAITGRFQSAEKGGL